MNHLNLAHRPGPAGTGRSWFYSLLPHLSARWRQRLALFLMAGSLLAPAAASGKSEASSNPDNTQYAIRNTSSLQNPYSNPAVGRALQQLGLEMPLAPTSSDFQVNTYTNNTQQYAAVAVDSDGDFVVVWESYGASGAGADTLLYSIQAQRFNSAGSAAGSQFQVNSNSTGAQRRPAVAMDDAGNFVVTWENPTGANINIAARRFLASGMAAAVQFTVNGYTTGPQNYPSISLDSDGDFVIVWQSNGSPSDDDDQYSIQARRYNSNATAQGAQFQVNSYTTGSQQRPAVSRDNDGDFVIVWQGEYTGGSDIGSLSIQGRRYNSSGTPQGVEFQVNDYTNGDQSHPAVALDDDGDFVVAWETYTATGDSDKSVQARLFNSSGTAQGLQFQVNSYTTQLQRQPAVAIDSDGDFAIVWHSHGSYGSDTTPDTNNYSIQGRIFNRNGLPLLEEFQINTITTDGQLMPAVGMDASGDFSVAWQSDVSGGSDSDYSSIQMQRFDLEQVELQVNNYSTGNQINPDVAVDSDGDFVIVWESNGSPAPGNDTAGTSIQARLYSPTGVEKGLQFQVNSYTTGNQRFPSVAVDSDGDFVVTWESDSATGDAAGGIQAQRYNSSGTAQGLQFQVNSYTTGAQTRPAVSLDSDGDFVVVWQSSGSSGGDTINSSVQGQRYNSVGTVQGSQFQVNTYSTGDQTVPGVARDSSGNFVVVWQSSAATGDGSGSIQAMRYNSVGAVQGSQFQVNSYTTGDQTVPALALDSDGDIVVVWQSNGSSGGDSDSHSIQGQRYNSVGTSQGSQFQVNSYTTGSQHDPDVGRDSDGTFVVVWASLGSSGNDSSDNSVQAQRYSGSGVRMRPQFQVNTYTNLDQNLPVVSLDSDGDFVVAWQSEGLSSSLLIPLSQPEAIEADNDYAIAANRFLAVSGPEPTAVTVGNVAARLPAGTGLWAGLAGLLAVLTGWWVRKRK